MNKRIPFIFSLGSLVFILLVQLSLFLTPLSTPREQDTYWYVLPIVTLLSLMTTLLFKNKITLNYVDFLFIILLIDFLFVNLINNDLYIANYRLISTLTGIGIYFYFKINNAKFIFSSLVLIISIIALYQIYDSINHIFINEIEKVEVGGLFMNSGYNSQFLALSAPALYNLLNTYLSGKFRIIIGFILTCLICFIIISLGSRVGIVSLIFGMITLLVKKWDFQKALLLIIVTLISLFAIAHLKVASSTGRLLILTSTFINCSDYLPFGLGTSSFSLYYPNWQTQYFIKNPESKFLYNASDLALPFNEWLLFLVENGLIWVILFSAITIVLLFKNETTNLNSNKILKSIILIIIIQSFTSNVFQLTPFLIIFFTSMGLISSAITFKDSNNLLPIVSCSLLCKISRYLISSLFLTLSILLFKNTISLYRWQEEKKKPDPNFEMLYGELRQNVNFLYQYSLHEFNKNEFKKSFNLLKEIEKKYNSYDLQILIGLNLMGLKNYQDAENRFLFCSHYIPHRLYPVYLLMKNNQAAENSKASKLYALRLLSMVPKIKSFLSDEFKKEAFIIMKGN